MARMVKVNETFSLTAATTTMMLPATSSKPVRISPMLFVSPQTGNKEAFRMQASDVYHTQGIKSFKITSTRYVNGT
jgi:hypothetical protein